ncbi:MAG: hypothetical protein B6I18_09070 [Bacteroidetes bacterium 4572_112]|nr:MAG: hypothetical protein B6I18_09070 [Bacteroidetes bacterium 4572_112]
MQKGVTLIEVLITGLILAFVLTGVSTYLILSARYSNEAVVATRAQSQLSLAYLSIFNHVTEGKEIAISDGILSITKTDDSIVLFRFNDENDRLERKEDNAAYTNVLIGDTNGVLTTISGVFNVGSGSEKTILIPSLAVTVQCKGFTKSTAMLNVSAACRN